MGLKTEYPDSLSTANDVLFALGFMYLCDVSFLAVTAIQTRYECVHFRTRPSNCLTKI